MSGVKAAAPCGRENNRGDEADVTAPPPLHCVARNHHLCSFRTRIGGPIAQKRSSPQTRLYPAVSQASPTGTVPYCYHSGAAKCLGDHGTAQCTRIRTQTVLPPMSCKQKGPYGQLPWMPACSKETLHPRRLPRRSAFAFSYAERRLDRVIIAWLAVSLGGLTVLCRFVLPRCDPLSNGRSRRRDARALPPAAAGRCRPPPPPPPRSRAFRSRSRERALWSFGAGNCSYCVYSVSAAALVHVRQLGGSCPVLVQEVPQKRANRSNRHYQSDSTMELDQLSTNPSNQMDSPASPDPAPVQDKDYRNLTRLLINGKIPFHTHPLDEERKIKADSATGAKTTGMQLLTAMLNPDVLSARSLIGLKSALAQGSLKETFMCVVEGTTLQTKGCPKARNS
ncbi:hypothetical protein EVAR_53309_1 [Eumeta japonica]|uniref:Uncharacterized protein n=1 Tax=Eumeta variegata TaxID=151549 RepID=A0A4C1X5T4_EUMVA|nr:hypothetical protein EVAR_53309_1 [Eumeta japonica]